MATHRRPAAIHRRRRPAVARRRLRATAPNGQGPGAARASRGGATKSETAPKWKPEYSESLHDADIVIIPDHDEPGRVHAKAIAQMSAGIASRIRLLDLAKHWPECPKGGDVSAWLAAGHSRAELDVLIEQAPDWKGEEEEEVPLPSVAIADWDAKPVPEREWTVLNRILLGGHLFERAEVRDLCGSFPCAVTLHVRGRDIEDAEKALQFDKPQRKGPLGSRAKSVPYTRTGGRTCLVVCLTLTSRNCSMVWHP